MENLSSNSGILVILQMKEKEKKNRDWCGEHRKTNKGQCFSVTKSRACKCQGRKKLCVPLMLKEPNACQSPVYFWSLGYNALVIIVYTVAAGSTSWTKLPCEVFCLMLFQDQSVLIHLITLTSKFKQVRRDIWVQVEQKVVKSWKQSLFTFLFYVFVHIIIVIVFFILSTKIMF